MLVYLSLDMIVFIVILLFYAYSILFYYLNKTKPRKILFYAYSILSFKQNHARWNEGTGINADLLSNKVKITFIMIFD